MTTCLILGLPMSEIAPIKLIFTAANTFICFVVWSITPCWNKKQASEQINQLSYCKIFSNFSQTPIVQAN